MLFANGGQGSHSLTERPTANISYLLLFAWPMGAIGVTAAMRTWGSDGGKSEECEGRGSSGIPENGGARIPGPECITERTAGNGRQWQAMAIGSYGMLADQKVAMG